LKFVIGPGDWLESNISSDKYGFPLYPTVIAAPSFWIDFAKILPAPNAYGSMKTIISVGFFVFNFKNSFLFYSKYILLSFGAWSYTFVFLWIIFSVSVE